jgi:amino acid permease
MATAAATRESERPSKEWTPLLVSQDTISSEHGAAAVDNLNDDDDDKLAGRTSFAQTVVNLMKTCMGTGCLALAFCAQQGGIVVFCGGLLVIAAWNVFAVQRLIQCLEYLPPQALRMTADATRIVSDESLDTTRGGSWEQQEQSNEGTMNGTTATRIHCGQEPLPPAGTSTLGIVAWYAFGPTGLQVLDAMMVILLIGIITAYLAAVVSFMADTPFTVGPLFDAVFTAVVMATISLVPNIGFLSHASAVGLLVLLGAFLVIAGYGVATNNSAATAPISLAVWPESLAGVSQWFGCVVFGFGVAPLTYNFRSSMREPARMVPATAWALFAVAAAYIIAGVGLYALYPHISGELLHELPRSGALPVLTRLAMVAVVWMTAPLLIVPCGQLLEGKWQTDNRAAVRFGICGVAVMFAVALPSFVQVLSFVGCACVGMVSFCMPPLLHLRLSSRSADRKTMKVDGIMLAWGLIATLISTFYSI